MKDKTNAICLKWISFPHFTMHYLKATLICCTCIFFLSYCKNKPVVEKEVVEQKRDSITIDTAQIEKGIRQEEKLVHAVYSDTVKRPEGKNNHSAYYSITNFYYERTRKELFKTENILVSANKSIFTAYFKNGEIVKSIADTDMGRYVDYFGEKENALQNNFRTKCFLLAKEQLSIFNERVRK